MNYASASVEDYLNINAVLIRVRRVNHKQHLVKVFRLAIRPSLVEFS